MSGIGILGDLSIHGCRVSSATPVQPGTEVELRVETSKEALPIQISRAVVRWSRAGEFGLEFVNIVGNEWARLQRLVMELEKEPFQRDNQDDESM